jgi:phosphatidylserine/phosphatidylglycerophosphate/cardiolipin synthase-like enzyme
MRRLVAAVLLACACGAQAAGPQTFQGQGTVEVAFAPWDDWEGMVVRAIEGARKQILVQAFSFTSRPIAAALIAARARGIDVQVTADRDQTFSGEGSRIPDLAAGGIPVWMEVRYQSAHNKVLVIDANTSTPIVVTGSANWTAAAARKNAENVLVLRNNHGVARAYADNWRRHRADALPYGRKRQ